MSKPASKAKVGAFVLGALALAVAALVIFGSGKFFSKRPHYAVYFEGSVKGLQIGAPVLFRGVQIGEVTSISLRLNTQDISFILPVEIEVDPEKLEVVGARPDREHALLAPLIDKGLRAQLQMSSLVTGQLAVYLDFFPEQAAKRLAPEGSLPPEIPAVRTDIQELAKRIQDLPM